jgi:hypothetical protein
MKQFAIVALLCVTAASAQAGPRIVPTLSGTYVYTNFENCGSGLLAQATGTVVFNPMTKAFRQKGFKIVGAPLTEQTVSDSGSYSNTATTLTFSGGGTSDTYNAFYRASPRGIASYFTGIILESGTCGRLLTMTRQ